MKFYPEDQWTRKQVEKEEPSAVKIKKVTGGWEVFDTWNDWEVWKNQK